MLPMDSLIGPAGQDAPLETQAYAPGKLILLGEHAVVYGQPALAGAIDRGCWVKLQRHAALGVEFVWESAISESVRASDLPYRAFAAALESLGLPLQGWRVFVNSAIPLGAGLGSSAALSVAMVRALSGASQALGLGVVSTEAQLALALQLEALFHGRSSGLDVTLSFHAQSGLFSKEAGFTPWVRAAQPPVRLVVANSGIARSTYVWVEQVARLRAAQPEVVDGLFEQIGALVREAWLALQAGELAQLGQLMTHNHALLQSLNLSNQTLERIIDIAAKTGALGAKITGAGGGGAVLILAPGLEERVIQALSQEGFSAHSVQLVF